MRSYLQHPRQPGTAESGQREMTIEEAIATIEAANAEVEWSYPLEYAVAFEMAIDALHAQTEARFTIRFYIILDFFRRIKYNIFTG